MKTMIRTGNECFDALANAKLAICEGLDIKVQVRVMNHSMDNLNIDEIGVIIGNLFDNAIEAVKNLKEKRIELDIQKQGKRRSIFMTNTVGKSVLSDNENLETTKVDKANHGFGIKNIQNIVTKHGGMIDFFEENDMFCCDILI
jgi:sensor histidine kinase regulating citrate/malate metabolism